MAKDQKVCFSKRIKKDKKNLFLNINRTFHEHMAAVYNIDLDIIIGISGSYYESDSCCSQIVFQLSNSHSDIDEGITFKQHVEFSTDNIRKLRKLLQMGNADQCLLAYAELEDETFKWKIKGLYGKGIGKENITFRLTQHMVWTMDMAGRTSVCYKCGKYVIENLQMEILKIEKKVKEVFNVTDAENMKEIFREAINQRHGTMIVVLRKEDMISSGGSGNKGEIARLIDESAGFEIYESKLKTSFIKSATSIDGAVFVDTEGICYGIGMILDGEKKKGDSKRGARYNSALRYVEQCKSNQLKCIVAVISEDQTIDVISTEDRYKENENV